MIQQLLFIIKTEGKENEKGSIFEQVTVANERIVFKVPIGHPKDIQRTSQEKEKDV